MSVLKRGKIYYLRIRPFGELINVRTSATSKSEARQLEMGVLTACRSGDYRALIPESREVCVRMFRNQGWELPLDLAPQEPVRIELTLWKAMELFLNYPGIKDSPAKERYIYALSHFVEKWGKDRPIKSVWIPDIRQYQMERMAEGAAPATVNKEKGVLSRLFQVLIELQQVELNPIRMVKRLSEKAGERQAYLSLADVSLVADKCPLWYRPLVWTADYTGMRRGEIVDLTRRQVNLSRRMIYLGPEATKERSWKRVPLHSHLAPILEECMKVSSLSTDKLFLLQDEKGIRAPTLEGVKNPWPRACEALEMEQPWPRFHDLRHTWKTNARRSGMDPEIREAILGHWSKQRSVGERYGRISEQELLHAIDQMTFDHGGTEIWVAMNGRSMTTRDQNVIKTVQQKKKVMCAHDLTQ